MEMTKRQAVKRVLAVSLALAVMGVASAAWAGDRGDRVERRLDGQRLEHLGDRIDARLDLRGDRIDRRLDRHAAYQERLGHDRRAVRLDLRGDRIDYRLDRRGNLADARLGRRGDRFDRRRERRH